MFNFFNTENKSNTACITFGKCSTDPISSALNETVIYEIRQLTYYILKIKEIGYENLSIVDTIIQALACTNLTCNNSERTASELLSDFRKKRNDVINFYKNLCSEKNLEYQLLQSFQPNDEDINLIKAIMTGEKQCIRKNTQISSEKKNLYEMMLMLAKRASLAITKLAEYDIFCIDERYKLLEFVNALNFLNLGEEKLSNKIIKFAKTYYSLRIRLNEEYEKAYGQVCLTQVKFDKIEGRGILVSGDNFYDLENLLKSTKDSGVKIYTHDKMIWAMQYPYFRRFSNLVAHYQHKEYNFPMDFSDFPGPILLTKYYPDNLDNIYRANIYSTDDIVAKGISRVQNNNFSPIIQSAQDMKGFKRTERNFGIKIGYNLYAINKKLDEISTEFDNGKYKDIYIVGLLNYGYRSNEYFEKLYQKIGDDNFIVSLAYEKKAPNVMHIKSFFDFALVYKIIDRLKANLDLTKHNIKVVLTHCSVDTITNMFILKSLNINDIYLTCKNANSINPSIMNGIADLFAIKILPENPDETEL